MRSLAALIVSAAACVLGFALPSDARAASPGKVVICFLPGDPSADAQLYSDLARRGGAVGLTSPTIDGPGEAQAAVDISQGARVSVRRYAGAPGALNPVAQQAGGSVSGWNSVVSAAHDVPASLTPGLLAQTVRSASQHVAYVGITGAPQPEDAIAADRSGAIENLSLGDAPSLADRASGALSTSDLVVVRLPPGGAGLAALDRLLGVRRPSDLVYVARTPSDAALALVPSAVFAPGFRAGFSSDSTHLPQVIASTDVTATALSRLGLARPGEVQGRPIVPASGTPAQAHQLAARYSVVKDRRAPVILVSFALFALVFALLGGTRGHAGIAAGLRIALLGALWSPAMALLSGGIAPSPLGEIALVAGGSLALAIVTDRLVSWPAGPVLPAATVFLAYVADLALGSPLGSASLFGPDPQAGARFYGIGNELEIFLAVSVLLGTGAALSVSQQASARRWFVVVSVLAAAALAPGSLGADTGAVVTFLVGGFVAAFVSSDYYYGRSAVFFTAFLILVALALVVAIDALTGGSHLTRSVLSAHNLSDLRNLAARRLDGSLGEINAATVPAVLACAALVISGVRRRAELFSPLEAAVGFSSRPRGPSPFRAGVTGAIAATLVAAVANDSAPMMFIVGTILIGLAVGYVQGDPGIRHRAGYHPTWA